MEKKYVRCANPNKAKFAALLDKARGTRTMKKFADDCGVNPSTFSRIYNQANKGASSEELIRIIAENAAPESGVTLDQLMEANGLVQEGSPMAARRLQESLEAETRYVLVEELKKIENVTVVEQLDRRVIGGTSKCYKIGKNAQIRPDVVVDNILLDGKKGAWIIDVFCSTSGLALSPGSYDDRRFSYQLASKMQQRIGRFWGAYCMESEDKPISRMSFAIYDEQVYELILDHFGEWKSNDSISFILIDLEKGIIEEEYVLANRNGEPGESIIGQKKHTEVESYEDGFDGIYWDEE